MCPLWLQERYRRALADSENVRRRTQKFVEDAKLFGKQKSCVYCTGQPAWAENADQQLSVPLSCPPTFISKPAVMLGLDSWYLVNHWFFLCVQLCPVLSGLPTESQNWDYFFLNSPSGAEFSSADLVENAGSAVCWGLALAGCILYSAVSSHSDLLFCINSLLCFSSLEVDAAWGSSCQSLD